MKKLIVLSLTLFLTIGLFAQGPFTGFFKPSKTLKSQYTLKDQYTFKAGEEERSWYFRPTAEVTAFRFDYNKEEKAFESSSFSGFGVGVSYQHYTDNGSGELVNNFGINALIMFDATQNTGIGLAATVNALQFVNIGAGYDLTNKNFFLLTGAVWTF